MTQHAHSESCSAPKHESRGGAIAKLPAQSPPATSHPRSTPFPSLPFFATALLPPLLLLASAFIPLLLLAPTPKTLAAAAAVCSSMYYYSLRSSACVYLVAA
uniref:Uncharacterized protein n=1 Tax=Oryza meridionalis TaxID=40149 RepID=A0A0E0ESR5_9ORYZ